MAEWLKAVRYGGMAWVKALPEGEAVVYQVWRYDLRRVEDGAFIRERDGWSYHIPTGPLTGPLLKTSVDARREADWKIVLGRIIAEERAHEESVNAAVPPRHRRQITLPDDD